MSPRLDPGWDSRGEGQFRESNHHKRKPEGPPLRLADLPARYISIDPGKTHCGVARWEVDRAARTSAGGGELVATVRLVEVYERTPDALYIELRELQRDGVGLIVCEGFGLQKGRNQQGSPLETVETIGVIKYLCRMSGLLCRIQPPSIKSYVAPWLRAQVATAHGGGVDLDSLASNSHKRDSIRHGLYPALRDPKDRASVRLVLDEHARKRG